MHTKNLISKKPVSDMSKTEKEQCLRVAQLLARDWQEKFVLADILGVSERVVRDRISAIGKRFPVISTSDAKGYKIATSINDLASAKKTVQELKSRANEILVRASVLQNFVEKMEGKNGTI